MLAFFVASLAGLKLVDTLLPRVLKQDQSARWFAIHAVANTVITALTFGDLLTTIANPFTSTVAQFGYSNKLPAVLTVTMHLYHVVAFSNLKMIDWVHHILSAFVSGGVALFFNWGPAVNAIFFFMSGLPGGIDYVLLTLVKCRFIPDTTEKRVNFFLNLCLRMPGLLIVSSFSYAGLVHSGISGPLFALSTLCFSLNIWNGVYFCHRVVRSYYYSLPKAEHAC